MAQSYAKSKGRSKNGSRFLGIPAYLLESEEYSELSAIAVKCLLDLGSQYNGVNNGDFSAVWKLMSERGWRSKDTLYRALHELEVGEWIIKTRRGGRNQCNLYAITWKPIDECLNKKTKQHKLDVRPTRVASNSWNKKIKTCAPVVGLTCPGSRANGRGNKNVLAR